MAVNGGSWAFVGPKPITGVGTNGASVGTYGATSGRVTSLAVDPTNAAIMYAGTAGGGVWKTVDSGTTWSPLTDDQASLAIGGVAVDAANRNVYAATGEDNRCGDCQYGQGILKSADGGTTWSIGGQTGLQSGPIAVTATTVLVGTDAGLLRSVDGGNSWGPVTSLNTLTATVGKVDALFVDPASPTRVWASVNEGCKAGGFIAVSDDSGNNWAIKTRMSALVGPPIERIALAEGPGGVLYAALAACNSTSPKYALGQFVAILKSTNSGASWTVITPTLANHLSDYFNSAPGVYQGDYDNVVAVDPANASRAVFGGITLLATSDGGATFNDIAEPYNGGPVHPDFHAAIFSGSTLIVGNDGGVYSTSASNPGATWSNLNASFAITTFYSGAALDANHIVGGAQDEGTAGLLPGGPTAPAWRELLGSDGGWVSLDPGSTAMYAEAPFGTIAKGFTTYNDASPWQLASPCAVLSDPACNEPVDFTTPFAVYWGTNPPTVFTGTNRIYRSTSGGTPAGAAGWSAISGDLTTGTSLNPNGDWITAMAFEAPNTLVVGSYGGAVQITMNATAANPVWTNLTAGLPPFDPNAYIGRPWITSLAVSGGQVWATVGTGYPFARVNRRSLAPGSPTWAVVDGSLPQRPVNSIALDPASPGTVYVGTDAGAFMCGDCSGDPTNGVPIPWALMGSGLPNAQVDAITMQRDGAAIVVFTHGRGSYTLAHRTAFSANPATVDFGYGTVGTAGPNTAVTITGSGVTASSAVAASITGPNAGDFSLQTANFGPPNCAAMVRLVPLATCQAVLNFNPGAEGPRTATLTVTDAQGGSLAVPLSGIGSHPVVSPSPTSLDFGSLNLGKRSDMQTITVNNTGQGPLTVSQVTASGDFDQSSGCYGPVPGGYHCFIYVTFTPTAHGPRTGTLSIIDNAAGSPHIVSLTGFGTQPIVSLSTQSLSFPDTPYPPSTPGPSLPVTISNTGDGLLTVQSISSSIPDYAVTGYTTNACYSGTVPPSSSCTANVTFAPTQLGSRNGTLTITDDASPTQQRATLTGTGVPAPRATLDTSPVNFGRVNIGTTPSPIAVKLSNTGTASLASIMISITATLSNQPVEYSQTNDCPSLLQVAQSCTITVTFTPNRTGPDYAALSVGDNASNSPQQVPIYGEGTDVGVLLQPNTLTFGNQTEGTTSPVQKVQLVKTGNGLLIINSVRSSTKDFAVTNDCPSSTYGSALCFLSIQFTPTKIGPLTGTIVVSDNATDGSSPQAVTVSGTGTPGPLATTSPSSLAFTFPPQSPGTTSSPKTVTLTNSGQAPLTISGVAASGDFVLTNHCPLTLAIGAACTVDVTFKPTTFGDLAGVLTFVDNAGDSPQTIQLSGTTNLTMSSGPDVSSWGPGRLDVFALGSDGALWHKYYDSSVGWQGWSSLGAPGGAQLTSNPGVVSWAKGRIDVFVRGSDSALWHKYYDSALGGWSGWYSHGGTLTSAPSAASWGYGRLDVFAKGSQNDLQHIFYSSTTGWSTWYSHRGNLTSAPGAVSWGRGRIDVFARGTTNDLQHIYYDVALNGWSTWYSHGGTLAGGPAASSWGRGRLDVFATANDGTVQHVFYDSSMSGWNPWGSMAGQSSADPGAVSWGPGRIDLFTRGLDNVLWHEYLAGSVASYWYRG